MSEYHQNGQTACLSAALGYRARGWSPLALCPPDHVGVGREHGRLCKSPGKAPLVRWKDYQTAPATADEVSAWWRSYPNANVGLALGPVSGLCGVDCDGGAGEARLAELSAGDLPPTLEFSTGKGRRLLYAIPPGVTLRSTYEALAISEELRLLGHGTQTVMPPSLHRSGDVYRWTPGKGPDDLPPAPAPAWLVAAMTADGRREAPAVLQDCELIEQGRRNEILTSMAGTMRKRGFSTAAILSALATENDGRCEPPLEDGEVEKIARSVGRYSPDAFAGVTIKMPGKPDAAPGSEGLDVTELGRVEPQPLYWLVPGLLPLGKLVLVAGDGGHGKSTLTLALAADLSRGRPAFGLDYPPAAPRDTLIACCEDDYADTVVPRLMAHGADLSRVHKIDGVLVPGGKTEPFSLACYEAIKKELARRPDVRLIVVDPAGAYIGRTGVDDYKDSDLRALLGPLSELAAAAGVTILLVKHLVKGVTAKAVHKVGGSAGYVNAVRAAYVVTPDADDPELKLLLPLKFNLGPRPTGMSYRLESLGIADRQAVLDRMPHLGSDDRLRMAEQLFRVAWKGEVHTSADDALAPPQRRASSEDGTKVERCKEWLGGLLDAHPEFFPSSAVEKKAKELGFSHGTYREARRQLKEGWLLVNHKAGDHWYVGPPNQQFRYRDEIGLLNSLEAWSLGFLNGERSGCAAPDAARLQDSKEYEQSNNPNVEEF